MSLPLSDTRLAEIRERVPSAVCLAAHSDEVDKGHVWVTGSLSGSDRCSACHLSQRALDSDEAVLLREVDRLSTALERMTRERDLLDVSVRSARRTTDRLRQERADAAQPRLLAEIEQLRAELANRVAAIAQVRETCARLYTDPDEESDPYRVGQDKMADLILEQLDEHSRALGAGR